MDGWLDGWMDGWMNRLMDGWMGALCRAYIIIAIIIIVATSF